MARYFNCKRIGVGILVIGMVCLVVGSIFVWQALDVKAKVQAGLADEQITTGLPAEGDEGYDPNNLYVDSAAEAQAAHDLILLHMREGETPRYGDTERGSTERAEYVDGITLRNSLMIAEMGFGVSTIALGVGVFMLITGFALGGTGLALRVRR